MSSCRDDTDKVAKPTEEGKGGSNNRKGRGGEKNDEVVGTVVALLCERRGRERGQAGYTGGDGGGGMLKRGNRQRKKAAHSPFFNSSFAPSPLDFTAVDVNDDEREGSVGTSGAVKACSSWG